MNEYNSSCLNIPFYFSCLDLPQNHHQWSPAPPASVWLPAHNHSEQWVSQMNVAPWWINRKTGKYFKASLGFGASISAVTFCVYVPPQFHLIWRACPWWRPTSCSTSWRPSPHPGSSSPSPRTTTWPSSCWRSSITSSSISLMVRT